MSVSDGMEALQSRLAPSSDCRQNGLHLKAGMFWQLLLTNEPSTTYIVLSPEPNSVSVGPQGLSSSASDCMPRHNHLNLIPGYMSNVLAMLPFSVTVMQRGTPVRPVHGSHPHPRSQVL